MQHSRAARIVVGTATLMAWLAGTDPASAQPPEPGWTAAPAAADAPPAGAPLSAQSGPKGIVSYAPRREIEAEYFVWSGARSVGVSYAPLVSSSGSLSGGMELGGGPGGPFALASLKLRAITGSWPRGASSAVVGVVYGVAPAGHPTAPRGLWYLVGGGVQPRFHSHLALRAEVQVLVPRGGASATGNHGQFRAAIAVVIGRD